MALYSAQVHVELHPKSQYFNGKCQVVFLWKRDGSMSSELGEPWFIYVWLQAMMEWLSLLGSVFIQLVGVSPIHYLLVDDLLDRLGGSQVYSLGEAAQSLLQLSEWQGVRVQEGLAAASYDLDN